MRVRVIESQPTVQLSTSDEIQIESGGRRQAGPSGQITVSRSGGQWRVGEIPLAGAQFTVIPQQVGGIGVNGTRYRGNLRFVAAGADRFDVVNDVDLEGYLKGVVPKEMLKLWTLESYKAQAIVARTYALYEWRTAKRGHFDLHDDERSQVYGGMNAESAKGNRAVDDTAGVVVAHGPRGQERIFKAYFSSCCGGVRQSSADGFGEPHLAMIDQNVGNLCNASPRFNWGPVVVSRDELTKRFRAWGARRNRPEKDIAQIQRVDIEATNKSGRPVRFALTDARGQRYSLSGEELRWGVNTNAAAGTTLYSSFVKPLNESQNIQFIDGHGWGHGVGMCQWCAQVQSERGVPHDAIVLSAYPGAVLRRAY